MSTTTDTSNTFLTPGRVFGVDAARILVPFVDRAEALPAQAERIMREGMDYAAEFAAGAPVDDEPALIRAARRYLDRNYPAGVAA